MKEVIARTYSTIVLFVGYTIYICVLVFAAWFFEYILFERDFGDWISVRWYAPVLIILVVAFGKTILANRRQTELDEFLSLSDPLESYDGPHVNTLYATGPIRSDQKIIGLVTVSVDSHAFCFWQKNMLKAVFNWKRIRHVNAIGTSGEVRFAVVSIRRTSGVLRDHELRIPWSRHMSRYAPSSSTNK